MATSLDMSLEDRIKSSRNSRNNDRARGRGRPRRGRGSGGSFSGGRMTGPVRRGPLMVNARPSPYTIAKSIRRVKSFPWRHDLLEDSIRAAGIPGIEIGTKLYVSNLDHGVTNEDIRELFSEIGELKRYAVHYDKNGRPSGSAEVVYTRRSDAFAALKRYNDVLLDGKHMKIEILGDSSEMPISARVNVTGVNGKSRRTVVMPGFGQTGGSAVVNRGSGLRGRGGMNSRGRGRGRVEGQVLGSRGQGGSIRGQGLGRVRGQGSSRRGRGRGGGRGKKPPTDKSADELDKELENYHAEAMHIS